MHRGTKKILIVDNEPDITYIVDFVLSHAGFAVTALNEPERAITELLSEGYGLLILDLMMPVMDGFTVLRHTREEKTLQHLPVLILSARRLTHEETTLVTALGAEMMAKPFEPQRLLEKAREMVLD